MSSRTRAINEKIIYLFIIYRQGGYIDTSMYRIEHIGNVIEEKSHSGKLSYA